MNEIIRLSNTSEIAQIPAYPADMNPALIYLSSVSQSSRRPIRESLNAVCALSGSPIVQDGDKRNISYIAFPWHTLRYQHVQAIRSAAAEKVSAATANRHLSALRGVLKACWRLGYLPAEEYQKAIDFDPVRGSKAKAAEKGRHIKQGEFSALVDACLGDGTLAGARDAAIIAVGYACGLRRAEIAGLMLSDWDDGESQLVIRHGKGNKERMVPIDGGARDALAAWLDARGDAPGAIFCPIDKADHPQPGGMSTQAIYYILRRRATDAKVKAFAPHDLRRSFAGDQLDAGTDLSTVQKMMGHANADTTAKYDRRDARAKKAAASRIHFPYVKTTKGK